MCEKIGLLKVVTGVPFSFKAFGVGVWIRVKFPVPFGNLPNDSSFCIGEAGAESTITEEDGWNKFGLNLGGIFHPCDESKRGDPSFEFEPDDDLSEEDNFVLWKGYKKVQKSKFFVIINVFARWES